MDVSRCKNKVATSTASWSSTRHPVYRSLSPPRKHFTTGQYTTKSIQRHLIINWKFTQVLWDCYQQRCKNWYKRYFTTIMKWRIFHMWKTYPCAQSIKRENGSLRMFVRSYMNYIVNMPGEMCIFNNLLVLSEVTRLTTAWHHIRYGTAISITLGHPTKSEKNEFFPRKIMLAFWHFIVVESSLRAFNHDQQM